MGPASIPVNPPIPLQKLGWPYARAMRRCSSRNPATEGHDDTRHYANPQHLISSFSSIGFLALQHDKSSFGAPSTAARHTATGREGGMRRGVLDTAPANHERCPSRSSLAEWAEERLAVNNSGKRERLASTMR